MALRTEVQTKLYPRHDVLFYLIDIGSAVDLNAEICHHRNCADISRFSLHQKLNDFEAANKLGVGNMLHNAMGDEDHWKKHEGYFVSGLPEAIEVLCEHGADVNYGSQDDDIPQHSALRLADERCGIGQKTNFVQVLLEWGPGPLVMSNSGFSTLTLAQELEIQRDLYQTMDIPYRHSHHQKLLKQYASGRIEPKHNYYCGRPCSCHFISLPETLSTTTTLRRSQSTLQATRQKPHEFEHVNSNTPIA